MVRTLRRLILLLLAVLLLLVVVATLGFRYLMANPDKLETYLSDLLGRQLSIESLSDLQLGRETSVQINGLVIASPAGRDEPDFLRLQKARVHLFVPSLWRPGPIVLNDLEVQGLRLELLAPADKEPNWSFGKDERGDSTAENNGVQLPVAVQQAEFRDSHIHYVEPRSDVTITLEGQLEDGQGLSVIAQGESQQLPLNLDVSLVRENRAIVFDLKGTLQQWQLALQGSLADPLAFTGLQLDSAEVTSGQTQLQLSGSLANILTLQGLSIALELNSPDLNQLELLESGIEPLPVAVTAQLTTEKDRFILSEISGEIASLAVGGELDLPQQLSVRQVNKARFDVQLGQNLLAGKLNYQQGETDHLSADIHAQRLDIRALMPANPAGASSQTGAGARAKSIAQSDGVDSAQQPLSESQRSDRLIPEAVIDLSWTQVLSADAKLRIDQLIVRDELFAEVEVEGQLEQGVLKIETFQWQGEHTEGELEMTLRDLAPGADVDLSLDIARIPLIWILTGEPDTEQDSSHQLSLKGRGETVRALAASLSGDVVVQGRGGQLKTGTLGFIIDDFFAELFSRIDPTADERESTDIVCYAGILDIDEGVVAISPGAVLRSAEIDVALGGTVDLESEDIEVVFNTQARKGLGVSASKALTPYIKLDGNLSHPQIGVNAQGLVVSGGAALFTGGLSILAEGLWDRWLGTAADPCQALLDDEGGFGEQMKKLLGRP